MSDEFWYSAGWYRATGVGELSGFTHPESPLCLADPGTHFGQFHGKALSVWHENFPRFKPFTVLLKRYSKNDLTNLTVHTVEAKIQSQQAD